MDALQQAREAHRVMQAVWVIVSMRQQDAVADEVARLGRALSSAIAAGDNAACLRAIDEARSWIAISAGVVVSRLQAGFEH